MISRDKMLALAEQYEKDLMRGGLMDSNRAKNNISVIKDFIYSNEFEIFGDK